MDSGRKALRTGSIRIEAPLGQVGSPPPAIEVVNHVHRRPQSAFLLFPVFAAQEMVPFEAAIIAEPQIRALLATTCYRRTSSAFRPGTNRGIAFYICASLNRLWHIDPLPWCVPPRLEMEGSVLPLR
jgi:hypothetical protein